MDFSNGEHAASPIRQLNRRLRKYVTDAGPADGGGLELMNRSMGFAALGFLTLVPLLIVVAAADPARAAGFAHWLSRGLSASESAELEILELFTRPRRTLRSTTSFSLAALAFFGLTFAAAVQAGYEKVWELPPARSIVSLLRVLSRQVLWLCLLVGYLLIFTNTPLRRPDVSATPLGTLGSLLITVLFLWALQKVVLDKRVGWKALLPGAVVTTLGLLGLRAFSWLVFSPLIVTQAVTYGPIGTMLIIQSWLVGVGFVVYGGARVGRMLHERIHRHAAQP
ncbi:YhjD/YihY/BrkB family envelope integrity protein [Streptomyces sp. NPDC058486]|uniref:YhjD/YihY/BrkB family envelope integrity protein n=1 Tax=unclassified Streptomyces TaxID=2593676 RepID=UPI00365B463C